MYGLNEKLLEKCIDSIHHTHKTNEKASPVPWRLHAAPKAQFYKILHVFLKNWKKTRSCTKSAIGTLYLAIDKHFAGRRPDNIYRYIDTLSKRDVNCDALMSYPQKKSSESSDVLCVSEMSEEISQLRKKLHLSKQKLCQANHALKDITNQKLKLQKERDSALKQTSRLKESTQAAKEDIEHLCEELENNIPNPDLYDNDAEYVFSDTCTAELTSKDSENYESRQMDLIACTKTGKAYSNSGENYITHCCQMEFLFQKLKAWSRMLLIGLILLLIYQNSNFLKRAVQAICDKGNSVLLAQPIKQHHYVTNLLEVLGLE